MKHLLIILLPLLISFKSISQSQDSAEKYARLFLKKIQSNDFSQWKDLLVSDSLSLKLLKDDKFNRIVSSYPMELGDEIKNQLSKTLNGLLFIETLESLHPRLVTEDGPQFINNLKIIKIGIMELEQYSIFKEIEGISTFSIPILFQNINNGNFYLSRIRNVVCYQNIWQGGIFSNFETIEEKTFANKDTIDILKTIPDNDDDYFIASDSVSDVAVTSVDADLSTTLDQRQEFKGKINGINIEIEIDYHFYHDNKEMHIYSIDILKGSQNLSVLNFSAINKSGDLYTILIDEMANPIIVTFNLEELSESPIYELKSDGSSSKIGYIIPSN